jgi:hypothetical protein
VSSAGAHDDRNGRNTPAQVMSPVLVHIGYHKTGTNWLQAVFFGDDSTGYRWLGKRPATHPVHRLIRDRPLDFNPAATRSEFEPLIEEAETAGLVPVISFPRLSGHPYSGGYDSKEIADRVKAVFPDARILIVIREQRSMIASTCKQYVAAGGVAAPEDFLDPATERGWRVPGFDFAHFEYHRLIGYYRSLYGPDAVLALPYEQFVEDAPGFIQAIAHFAGHPVPEDVLARLPYANRSNQAQSALTIAVSRPLNRFGRRSDLNPTPLVESKLLSTLAKRVRRTDVRSPVTRALAARSEERLRNIVREAIGDRYVESNRATAEMIGVDLAAYGWML